MIKAFCIRHLLRHWLYQRFKPPMWTVDRMIIEAMNITGKRYSGALTAYHGLSRWMEERQ